MIPVRWRSAVLVGNRSAIAHLDLASGCQILHSGILRFFLDRLFSLALKYCQLLPGGLEIREIIRIVIFHVLDVGLESPICRFSSSTRSFFACGATSFMAAWRSFAIRRFVSSNIFRSVLRLIA